ncbi:hypothetical protein [Streptomyces sp. ISL-100]|uniref:zinc finger domain-containing protein n=1 Tax=Streptomyces sp. ISL-100 TaxID=2819173 RepID=UPI001BED0CB7|nr:hypothetical protein [Streptomyces sp. ISL-100]MBT2401510.1 hypothetical protein [Streptomyces sp. ISL-100]
MLTVTAAPAWFEYMARAEEWPDFAEDLAAQARTAVNPHLCLSTDTQTGIPCRIPIRDEPCVHHGPQSNENRCGAATKSGNPCRFNLVAHRYPCPSHPETYDRIQQAEAQEKAEQEAEAEEWAAEQCRMQEKRTKAALELACPHCEAPPASPCVMPNSGNVASKLHGTRYRRLDHALQTKTPCPSCGAEASAFCRTSSGLEAADVHAARRHRPGGQVV